MKPIKTLFKFPGNKRQLVPQIMPLIPSPTGRWIEPFCGGGATAIAAWRRGDHVVISDKNQHLMQFYRCLQDPTLTALLFTQSELTFELYNELDGEGQADVYTKIQDSFNSIKGIEALHYKTVANYFFLTQAGFNGMQRENKSGKFNVPRGKSANKETKRITPMPDRRDVWNEYVEFCRSDRVTILDPLDWRDTMAIAEAGDVVVCDPPYADSFKTKVFKQYLAGGFPDEETKALYEAGAASPASVAIHNSRGPIPLTCSEELGYNIFDIYAPRTISCDGNRATVKEILSVC